MPISEVIWMLLYKLISEKHDNQSKKLFCVHVIESVFYVLSVCTSKIRLHHFEWRRKLGKVYANKAKAQR